MYGIFTGDAAQCHNKLKTKTVQFQKTEIKNMFYKFSYMVHFPVASCFVDWVV